VREGEQRELESRERGERDGDIEKREIGKKRGKITNDDDDDDFE